jgi:hypothetical protein
MAWVMDRISRLQDHLLEAGTQGGNFAGRFGSNSHCYESELICIKDAKLVSRQI